MSGENGHHALGDADRSLWGGTEDNREAPLDGLDLSGLALTQDYRSEAKDGEERDTEAEERRAYSGIISDFQNKISIAALWGFTADYRPGTKKERTALRSVAELVDRELHSPVCQRKRLIKESQERQAEWLGKIPADEREAQTADARHLYNILERAEQVLINIKHQYDANPPGADEEGLQWESEYAARWYTQQERVRQVKEKAAEALCHEAYMYFLECLSELAIVQQIAGDIAAGLMVRDYSDLLEELGDAPTRLETEAPELYGSVLKYCLLEQSEDNPKLNHIAKLFAHVYVPKQQKRGLFSRKEQSQGVVTPDGAPYAQEYR